MSFLRNTWYVAAWSGEVGRTCLARKILGEPVMLYRTAAGKPVALLDRCPHRLLPLSLGTLQGDTIECGYHGLTFDSTGQCIRAPGQDRVPPGAAVRAYPVAEHMGMVWIWPGDPALADRSKLFDQLPQWANARGSNPRWALLEGPLTYVKSNYLLLSENLVDPAHVVYVHKRSLGSPAMANIPIDTSQQGDTLLVTRWTPNAPASPILQRYGKWAGNVDRWQYYWMYPPHIAVVDFGAGLPGMDRSDAGRDAAMRLFTAHFMTPETAATTHYFWMVLRNFAIGDGAVASDLIEQVKMTFMEDKAILEAIEAAEADSMNAEAEPLVTSRVKLAVDAGSVRLRRTVDRMIAEEEALRAGARPRAAAV